MAEKSPHKRYLEQLRFSGLKKSYEPNFFQKWVSKSLFDEIRKFNDYYKLDSWKESLRDNVAYNEIHRQLGAHKRSYNLILRYGINEAKNEKNPNHAYDKICKGVSELQAELKVSNDVEKWHMENETLELFSVSWSYLYNQDEFVISKSQLKNTIKELEQCKKYLELKHPNLTAPIAKEEHSPAPYKIEPPQPPKEDTSELYAGLEWKADLADLAELIKGLAFTKSIQKNGKSITQKDLQALFESLFNTEIGDLHGTFTARLKTKKHLLNKFFIEKISDHVESLYKEAANEIRKQAEREQEKNN